MKKRFTRLALIVAALVAATLVAACADEDEEPTATPTEMVMAVDDEGSHEDDRVDLASATVDRTLAVEMQDIAFVPASLEVAAGEVVEIAFTNVGVITHDFTIEHADMDVMMMGEMETAAGHEDDDHDAGVAMHVALETGHGATLRMRVHEPGEYEFSCTVPGHREAGMVGMLMVR
jgi:uncharacterized cupredoxin-like copper-binding protein